MTESADRDANRELRERLADVYGRYARLRSDLDDLQRRLASLQVSAVSADGMVRATVGPRGQLTDLRIDKRAVRVMDSARLARTILETVRDAAERSAEQVEALTADYLPAGSGVPAFLRDNDFTTLMRRSDANLRDLTQRGSLDSDE